MPRVSTRKNDAVVARVPRRQVPKKTTKTRTRVASVDKPDSHKEKREERSEVVRKAPTNIENISSSRKISRRTIVIGLVFVFTLITTIWIGTSDKGQIDVSARIVERNNQIASGEFTNDLSASGNGQNQVVPVQNSAPSIPNGGLKGRGVGTPPVAQKNTTPTENIGTSTATTTATTTTVTNAENEEGFGEVEGVMDDGDVAEENLGEGEGETSE